MKKKILIIGNSVKESALARKLAEKHDVYVAPGSDSIKEFATIVDIREDAVHELLDFVMENDIDLTMPVSNKAINSSLVELFVSNNQQVFAPSNKASRYCFDKAGMKKLLYKLRIQTPKFGIFEKQNLVSDYLKNQKTPFVLKTSESSSSVVLTSITQAKTILDSFFVKQNQKVIIEDYIYGTPFSFYAITDGYKALPFGSAIVYRHSLEGDGGQLTSGMGACSPNYKMSFEHERFIMENVIYPTIDYLEMENTPYIGILGVNGIIAEDGNISILGYQPFMQDSDCSSVLSVMDEDLYSLFEACIIGSFSDEYDYIRQHNLSAVSLVLNCRNKDNFQNAVQGLELLDDDTQIDFYPWINKNKYLEYEAINGSVLQLTASSSRMSTAVEKVYTEAESIDFKGVYYRKDICKPQMAELLN